MIFVAVGTTPYKFSRLINQAIVYAQNHPRVPMIIQSGPYMPIDQVPSNVRIQSYFPYKDVSGYIKSSQTVVCHGGMGTILLALSLHKTPWVLPRRMKLKEHANNHQVALASHLSKRGLIRILQNESVWRFGNYKKSLHHFLPPKYLLNSIHRATTRFASSR